MREKLKSCVELIRLLPALLSPTFAQFMDLVYGKEHVNKMDLKQVRRV